MDAPLTIPGLLDHWAGKRGDALMLVCDGERLTYGEAERRSRRMAKGLIASGATKGSHVALLLPNGADFVVAMLAASRIGATVLPLSTLSTPDEVAWLLFNSDSSFLIAAERFRSRDFCAVLAEALPGLDLRGTPPLHLAGAPWLRRVWFCGEGKAGYGPEWSVAALDRLGDTVEDALLMAAQGRVTPADRAVIIHTSGSTSRPKGVIHAHGTLIQHLVNINRVRELREDDILFGTSPWFWVAGFAFALLGTLVAGARIVCSNETEPSKVLDFIERERPTMGNGYAPAMIRYANDPSFERRDFSSMRRGNLYPIMPPDVRPKDMELRHNIYGMTEVGGALTMSGDETDQPEHRRNSLGQLLPGFEARIVDPETGEVRGPDEVGELWLRGPLMMEGYYGRLRSEIFSVEGWWKSGDLVRIDRDGFFYIEGRLGNLIKTAGANVTPGEVEAVLRMVTGSAQCIVLGLPDAERGEAVVAVVVTDHALNEDLVRKAAARKLSSYKVPRHVLALREAELPLLSSGKVDLPALRTLFARRHPSVAGAIE